MDLVGQTKCSVREIVNEGQEGVVEAVKPQYLRSASEPSLCAALDAINMN